GNRAIVEQLASELAFNVRLDCCTPVAPYGTMFWFRPRALRKLFERRWQWEDFNAEPNHVDGGLAHALERLIGYAAIDAGYVCRHIASVQLAAQNYVSLEWKLQLLLARL